MTVGSVKLTVVKMTVVKMRLLLLVSALLGGAPVLAADPDLVSEVKELKDLEAATEWSERRENKQIQ